MHPPNEKLRTLALAMPASFVANSGVSAATSAHLHRQGGSGRVRPGKRPARDVHSRRPLPTESTGTAPPHAPATLEARRTDSARAPPPDLPPPPPPPPSPPPSCRTSHPGIVARGGRGGGTGRSAACGGSPLRDRPPRARAARTPHRRCAPVRATAPAASRRAPRAGSRRAPSGPRTGGSKHRAGHVPPLLLATSAARPETLCRGSRGPGRRGAGPPTWPPRRRGA